MLHLPFFAFFLLSSLVGLPQFVSVDGVNYLCNKDGFLFIFEFLFYVINGLCRKFKFESKNSVIVGAYFSLI